jgi:hypothetical protein
MVEYEAAKGKEVGLSWSMRVGRYPILIFYNKGRQTTDV